MEEKEKLLIRSYDEELTAEEHQKLAAALSSSEQLRKEKETLDKIRHDFSTWSPDFQPGFTEKVMMRMAGENPFVFRSVFRAVALSGVAAIILVLLSVYFMDGSLNLDSLLGIHGYAPDLGMLSMF
ncbi:hypothetical protein LA303_02030 [Candidatus Sulfidibacterium hydrothermale]|uniref:hypothetical protein n=1 Tax=Candidatus Sulfidibacterium hydrothermale TaxID=2875962 RepID=UPI001F0A0868|nr:hypothetical protein [Candidatus Sulfidibacterium hydrothermale]UBM62771.1 hypothetical protein LA303_02030 [Candidatus Sulfidibacterium hydrothermale]